MQEPNKFTVSAAFSLVAVIAEAAHLLLLVPSIAVAQESVKICAGKSRSTTFAEQVQDVKAESSAERIAVGVLNKPADGYFAIEGLRPGRATITVTGKRVRYLTGIPEREKGKRVNIPPVAEYPKFKDVFEVTVEDCGGAAGAKPAPDQPLPLPSVAADETVEMCPDTTRSTTFKKDVREIQATSSNGDVVKVRDSDSRVTLTAKKPGKAIVTVSAKIVRFVTGIPEREKGKRVNRPPLGEEIPFSKKFLVTVKSPEECEKKTDKAKTAATSKPDKDLKEVCLNSTRAISLPPGINRPRVVSDDDNIATATVKPPPPGPDGRPNPRRQGQVIVEAKGLGTVKLKVEEIKPRVNTALYRETFQIKVKACNLTGDWSGDIGKAKLEQNGTKVRLIMSDGQIFEGTVRKNEIMLSRTRTKVEDPSFPANMPANIRQKLVPSRLEIRGTLSGDEESIDASIIGERVKWEKNTIVERKNVEKAFQIKREVVSK